LWSNPTPRASLGGSSSILNSWKEPFFLCTKRLATRTLQTSQNKIVSNNDANTELEGKIDAITQDMSKSYFRNVLKKLAITNPKNAKTICDYITAEITELNIKTSTKEGKIKVLVWLSDCHNRISFNEMTKSDILVYLNGLRKAISYDPSQTWIGSYNGRQMILLKFFRWVK
jgi:hypothetical protein